MLCLITVNASFDYPEYPLTVSDPGNEGVDKYRVCSRSTDFYTRNGYSSLDSSIEKSFHLIEESPLFIAVFGASPYPLTCLEALEHYDSIDPDTSVNPYPPPDDYIHSTAGIGGSDTNCCSALRYTTDLDIESEVSHNTVVLNIVEEYGDAQSEEFVTLCEELWACSSYVDQYSENRCEANESNLNRGCEPYVARTLCFNEAYNPTSEQEIKQRRAFIVESCKFRLLWSVYDRWMGTVTPPFLLSYHRLTNFLALFFTQALELVSSDCCGVYHDGWMGTVTPPFLIIG
jgi:hypothetical protein